MSVFRSVKGIKIYVNDSHLFINLVQDKYGCMFYHRWFEEMNFGGGPDFLEESFSLVKDEHEAELMFQGKLSMYLRLGHIPFAGRTRILLWQSKVLQKVQLVSGNIFLAIKYKPYRFSGCNAVRFRTLNLGFNIEPLFFGFQNTHV